ncbi:MAG: mevalonate kinase [Deltaproteobacteria bacterium]|nr:mevalonate kinase [Deltaproteobacteria bacterium]
MDRISASGKVILFGEHSVVYGHPALAMGIGGALVAESVTPAPRRLTVEVSDWGLAASDSDPGIVGEALRRIAAAVPGSAGCRLVARARIPAAAGLGSSAALAVLAARALSGCRDAGLDDEGVRAAAHQAECVFHGRPSGLDDAVATHGGLCLFRRSEWTADDRLPVPARPLAPGLLRVAGRVPPLVVGQTGVARSTAVLVAAVRARRERDPAAVDALFAAIGRSLDDGLRALASGERAPLGAAMSGCQASLDALGLSCAEIDRMIAIARDHGALGAKLTGGGGGGSVIAVASPGGEQAILGAWAAEGFAGRVVNGVEGDAGVPQ